MTKTTSTSTDTVSLLVKLEKHLKSNNYKLQPFTNHPLVKYDEYTKKLYLEMLAFVFYATSNITEEAKFHLQRLIYSILPEEDTLNFLSKGIRTDEDQLNEFIKVIAPSDLKYCFLVDSIVLLHLSDSIEHAQYQFIATLSQHFKISYDEVQILSEFSKSILEQNTDLYNQIMSSDKNHFYETLLLYYFDEYVNTKCIITSDYINIYSNNCEDISQILSETTDNQLYFSAKRVILDNVTIDMSKWKCLFNHCKQLHIKNCTFIGKKYELYILNCNDIIIENCTFENYSSRVIHIEQIINIKFIDCRFIDCKFISAATTQDWSTLGAIFYSPVPESIKNIEILKCSFEDCGGIHSNNYYRSAILSNCYVKVHESIFSNCWHWHTYNNIKYVDPDHSHRTLFTDNSTQTNSKFVNSAKFN